jgi:hypothetical protein
VGPLWPFWRPKDGRHIPAHRHKDVVPTFPASLSFSFFTLHNMSIPQRNYHQPSPHPMLFPTSFHRTFPRLSSPRPLLLLSSHRTFLLLSPPFIPSIPSPSFLPSNLSPPFPDIELSVNARSPLFISHILAAQRHTFSRLHAAFIERSSNDTRARHFSEGWPWGAKKGAADRRCLLATWGPPVNRGIKSSSRGLDMEADFTTTHKLFKTIVDDVCGSW